MKKLVPALFTFIFFIALYLPALGASYGPPLTNAGTIYTSDVVVVGKSVGEPTIEQWLLAETNNNGEDIFVPQQMIVREFLVEEVLDGQNVEPNSIIRINYVAPQGDEEKRYSSGNGEQVLLALQFDGEAHRMGHGGFINTNPKMIKTEGKLESTKAWAKKVRTADTQTINQLIKDEWREMGYNYPSSDNTDHKNEDDQPAHDSERYQSGDEENFTVSYEEAEIYDYEVNGNPQYLRSPEDESVLWDEDIQRSDNPTAESPLSNQVSTAESNDANSNEKTIIGTQQSRSTASTLFVLLGLIGFACLTLLAWRRRKKP